MSLPPLKTITVGVVVERSSGASRWADVLWRPVQVLSGVPDTPAWTKLSEDDGRTAFYAGAADIELFRSEAGNYRENLLVERPLLWVALNASEGDPPYRLAGVTADPAEGEAWASLGHEIVETIAMPDTVLAEVAAFVEQNYVEQPFRKRKRDRVNPEALARRSPMSDDGKR
ncbi:MAG TPA: DUF3305 domain-containing protein [Pseudolabrys sp.]|nr:DUF3305 domain-containing protein [Pseudolabrys sp.]